MLASTHPPVRLIDTYLYTVEARLDSTALGKTIMPDLNKVPLLDPSTAGQAHVTLLNLLTGVVHETDAHAIALRILQDAAGITALARVLDGSVAQVEALIVDLCLPVASPASFSPAVERGRRDGDAVVIARVVLFADVAVFPPLGCDKIVAWKSVLTIFLRVKGRNANLQSGQLGLQLPLQNTLKPDSPGARSPAGRALASPIKPDKAMGADFMLKFGFYSL